MILVAPWGQRYVLLIGDNVIGRGSDCDLCLRHGALSRRHAMVRWDGEQATIIDLGSTNGTVLNGQELVADRAYPLRVGDRLELGGAEGWLEVRAAGEPEVVPPVDAEGPQRDHAPGSVRDQDIHPYVGPRAFQQGERLYGRDHEVLDLLDLLIAERIVLLYSPSGAGKTSLIQAALIPELEAEGFYVLPPMRVSLEASQIDPPEANQPANAYLLSLLLSLEEALPPEQQTPLGELTNLTLSDYLDRRYLAGDQGDSLVLIVDQFEEILTVDPTNQAAKAEFFEQVGQALRDRRRWALFAMREEFLAGLDPYLRPVPTRLNTTYRLELLGPEAALEAIQKPARRAGADFVAGAAQKLLDDLRTVRVQRSDGTTENVLGPYVEPVQLQVVCRRLWDRLPEDDLVISESDVEAVGDVDSALAGYYAERVAATAERAKTSERVIREWVERELITEHGLRGQVLQGPKQSRGLNNPAIWHLVDAHLVRAEKRRGATWFELAHDRLMEPVRADNAAWREAHLSPLQRQAALWDSQDRPADLLLRDEALGQAELWLADHRRELMPVERAFVAACQEAAERAALEEQARSAAQLRRFRRLAIGQAVGFGLAVVVLAVAETIQVYELLLCPVLPLLLLGIGCAIWAIISTLRLSTVEILQKRRDKRDEDDQSLQD